MTVGRFISVPANSANHGRGYLRVSRALHIRPPVITKPNDFDNVRNSVCHPIRANIGLPPVLVEQAFLSH